MIDELFDDDTNTGTSDGDHTGAEDKYAKWDQDALLRKAREADNFIAQLKREKDQQLEDFMATVKSMEGKLESASRKPSEGNDTSSNRTSENSDVDISKIVDNAINSRLAQEKQKANTATIKDAAKAVYGDNFQKKLSEIRDELGLSREEAGAIAATSPEAFRRLFNLNAGNTSKPNRPFNGNSDNVSSPNLGRSTSLDIPESDRYSEIQKLPFTEKYKPAVQARVRKYFAQYGDEYLKS